jgi:FkbH-like protein
LREGGSHWSNKGNDQGRPAVSVVAAISLNHADPFDLTTAELDRRFREISARPQESDVRVAWLGNHTLDPLMRATTVFADAFGVQLQNHVGAFDQHFQEILDGTSPTRRMSPNAIVLSLSLRGLAPRLVYGSGNLEPALLQDEIARAIATMENWLRLALANTQAQLLICNFVRPPSSRFGPVDYSLSMGEHAIYRALNERLAALAAEDARVTVLDTQHAAACAGLAGSWNPRMYHMAKIEWDSQVVLHMGQLVARACRAVVKPPRKCLVVDLDNTLWGGVLGEDGLQGIRIGQGDPVGESFAAFQAALLDVKARGVLLALCSKNNAADVDEAFAVRSDMPLAMEDFAYKVINWDPKHKNIKVIANALNIGLDSLAFVDDNPVECALVRQMLPDVLTLQLPEDPSTFSDFIYQVPDFDTLRVTAEDANKTQQYAENAKRQALQETVGDLNAFLESLDTQVDVAVAGQADTARIHQLFTKTNQFNLTTIRYTRGDIANFLAAPECHLHTIRSRDKFGDLGMIGVYLLRQDGDLVEIDSFVMSCRALGRGIESAACNLLKEFAFGTLGARALQGCFLPTAKNKPAADFYERQGFSRGPVDERGAVFFQLSADDAHSIPCPGINAEFKVGNDE